jgi:hypothetical protein
MDHTRTLLNGIPTLQQPCDLDLLVFFAKHPRTLLSREQLARLLGYDIRAIARSLDVLMEASLVTRSHKQNGARPARMYVFSTDAMNAGPLPAIVGLASSREGRLELRRALTHPEVKGTDSPAIPGGNEAVARADGADLELVTHTPLRNRMSRLGGDGDGE